MIFYKNLVSDLKAYGFTVNPYYPFVANMYINVSQLTVLCHVDDFKVSHKDSFDIKRLSAYLTDIYGMLKVNRGKLHNHLGIDLDYSEKVVVKLSIFKYINNVLHNFPERLVSPESSPSAEHIFNVISKSKSRYLPEDHAHVFHHIVAHIIPM